MKYIGITALIVSLGLLTFFLIRTNKRVHVTDLVIHAPFKSAWTWLSDPLKYPTLYPNWIKTVELIDGDRFKVNDQFGKSYEIRRVLDHEFGIIDIEVGAERSRMRIYSLGEHETGLIHIATRWAGISRLFWFFHQRTTDKDLENAMKVIEAGS